MSQPSVILFENAAAVTDAICEPLAQRGVRVTSTMSKEALLLQLDGRQLVILGPSVVRADSILELAQSIRVLAPGIALLVLTSGSSEDLAIAALRAGINEYIKYPFTSGELTEAMGRCISAQRQKRHSSGNGNCDHGPVAEENYGIVGQSAAMQEVRLRVKKMGASSSNILITGETGTGKELVAELVHKNSPRRKNRFVTLNCAAIPDGLLESELFGYERGAFTGATSRHEGKVKAADGGSVFLDEIGDMSSYGQAKLLRMIEGKEIQRLGGRSGMTVDVRIIAATNQDLEMMVRDGKFRKDLFFRLNVARIHVPPLRERKEDLPLLVHHFVQFFNLQFGREVERLSDEAMDTLLAYEWPGNIRELKNLLEGIFVELSQEDRCPQLPSLFRRRCEELRAASGDERDRLLWALSNTNWNKSKAASKLNWSRMTLYRKMARYNIS